MIGATIAADAPTTLPPPAPAPTTPAPTKPAPAPSPAPPAKPPAAAAQPPAAERFEPSERVRADFEVSFPVDI
jgi:hypothetical protein